LFDKCKRFHGQPMRNKHLTEDGKVVSLARKDLMAEDGTGKRFWNKGAENDF